MIQTDSTTSGCAPWRCRWAQPLISLVFRPAHHQNIGNSTTTVVLCIFMLLLGVCVRHASRFWHFIFFRFAALVDYDITSASKLNKQDTSSL
jgi:hypothetical protein